MSAIYLAARYGRREEMGGVAIELRRRRHTVTSRWLLANNPNEDGAAAVQDLQDLMAADTVVAFTDVIHPGGLWRSRMLREWARGGRHVELGLALAARKRVIVVGVRENVFHHLGVVELVPDVVELLRLVGTVPSYRGRPERQAPRLYRCEAGCGALLWRSEVVTHECADLSVLYSARPGPGQEASL